MDLWSGAPQLIVEKSFDKNVVEHLGLTILFGSLGWKPFLHISGVYYSDLVREFYANMFHKTDKDLSTIISIVKGVRIILDRERLASILGIMDEGSTIIVDSNKKSIDKD